MTANVTITKHKHFAELSWTATGDVPAGRLAIHTEDPLEEGTTAKAENEAHLDSLARLLEAGGAFVTMT